MFLYKLLTYYSISFLIYRIIKSKLDKQNSDNLKKEIIEINNNNSDNLKKEIIEIDNKKCNIESLDNSNKKEFNIKKMNNYELKIEKNNLNNNQTKIEKNNLNNNQTDLIIYKNIDKKIINKNNIDIELFNISKKELKNKYKHQKILVENNIYNQNTDNIIIDKESLNNYIIYNFNTYPNYNYKININITVNNIDNIKIIITDNINRYIYNHKDNINNYSYNQLDGIKTFNLIIDNNEFTFDKEKIIYVYVYFYNKNDIIIDNININVLQRNIIKSQESIIIYKVNNSINPIFTNVCNILNYNTFNNYSMNLSKDLSIDKEQFSEAKKEENPLFFL